MSQYDEMENALRENEFIFLIQNSPCTVMGLWQRWTFGKVCNTVSAPFDLYTNGFPLPVMAFSELLQTLKWEMKMEFWEDRTCHDHSDTAACYAQRWRRHWRIPVVMTFL